MQDPSASVNAHFLQHLVKLAAEEEVKATEDVYSATGIKLIGKGTQINETLYERIVSHKLMKPLEGSIRVGEPVTANVLSTTAESLLDSSPSLAKLLTQGATNEGTLGIVKRAHFGEQAGSLLKVHESRLPRSLSHGVLVGLLSMGMMKRLRPGDLVALDNLIVASIFHDIGELYIDPALHTARTTPMTAEEWRQMAAHPAIGHAVLKNMGGVAPIVAELVLEHHERMDGGGYPQGRDKSKISTEGHVLAVAEALSQFVGKHTEPFAYAEIALKIIPGEFSTAIIDVVSACREELRQAHLLQAEIDGDTKMPSDFQPNMTGLFQKIGTIIEAIDAADVAFAKGSEPARKILKEVRQRFERITRAISSSGLDIAISGMEYSEANQEELKQIHLEFDATLSEVRWRLIELSRRVTLQSLVLPPAEIELFKPLVEALGART
ncbi:MAG TPA: HD domain-containing phosphohydrolase [Rhodocyclaceae bacterium]|nr:HD domain-containing phosphohydrolase [Rhodocyclaceae bacterium]